MFSLTFIDLFLLVIGVLRGISIHCPSSPCCCVDMFFKKEREREREMEGRRGRDHRYELISFMFGPSGSRAVELKQIQTGHYKLSPLRNKAPTIHYTSHFLI